MAVPSALIRRAEKARNGRLPVLAILKVSRPSSFVRIQTVHVLGADATIPLTENGSSSASPSSESSPSKTRMSDESPFIRPSSPTQSRSRSLLPTFRGDTSVGLLQTLTNPYLTCYSLRCVLGPRL